MTDTSPNAERTWFVADHSPVIRRLLAELEASRECEARERASALHHCVDAARLEDNVERLEDNVERLVAELDWFKGLYARLAAAGAEIKVLLDLYAADNPWPQAAVSR